MTLGKDFDRALMFAHELHRTQLRKGDRVPYIAHLLAVASLVLDYGGDEEEAIAALLHDAVEDQGGAPVLAEIRSKFGDRVAGIVAGCTDSDADPKPPWQQRKEAFLQTLPTASPSVRRVVMADKLHNVRSTLADYRANGEHLWQRFHGAREGTLWYYRSLARTLGASDSDALTAEFQRAVEELMQLTGDIAKESQ